MNAVMMIVLAVFLKSTFFQQSKTTYQQLPDIIPDSLSPAQWRKHPKHPHQSAD